MRYATPISGIVKFYSNNQLVEQYIYNGDITVKKGITRKQRRDKINAFLKTKSSEFRYVVFCPEISESSLNKCKI